MQTDGMAVGSLLSPMVANLYMEAFEHLALAQALFWPSRFFFCCVDDTFVIWPHGCIKYPSLHIEAMFILI